MPLNDRISIIGITEADGFQQFYKQTSRMVFILKFLSFVKQNHRVTMPDVVFRQTIQQSVQLYKDHIR